MNASSSSADVKSQHMYQQRALTSQTILHEVQDLKQKIQQAGHTSFLQEPERKFWEDLVDSNIRAGSLACLWCIKAQVNKKLSSAFNKWKLNAALIGFQEKQRKELEENKRKPVQDALKILSNHKDGETSFLSRLVEAEQDVNAFQVSSKPNNVIHSSPSNNPNDTSLDMIHSETEDFAKLSLTLVDKDIDAETKRRLLLAMSRNILGKTQALHQLQQDAEKPHHVTSFSPSRQKSLIANTNIAGSFVPAPPDSKRMLPFPAERESWNGYLSRASRAEEIGGQTFDTNGRHPGFPMSDHHMATISGQSHTKKSVNSALPLSPSRNHHSQEELVQFLNFRRDAQGQYVKGLFSPLPQHLHPQQHQEHSDRYRDVLAQAAKHRTATHQQHHLHDHPHAHPLHSHHHHHHHVSSSVGSVASSLGGSGIHSYSNSSRGRDRARKLEHFNAKDDDDGSRAHSYGLSDNRSEYSRRSSSRSRSRSSSPSAIPGYLQVTRSYLKKTRPSSPPPAALSQLSTASRSRNSSPHMYSSTGTQRLPPGEDNGRHDSRPSSRPPSRNSTQNANPHASLHGIAVSETESGLEDSTAQRMNSRGNHVFSRHSSQENKRAAFTVDKGDDNNSLLRKNRISDPISQQYSTSLPTPPLFDAVHHPHLDNSHSIKAYVEASLREFELRKPSSSSHATLVQGSEMSGQLSHPPFASTTSSVRSTKEVATVAEVGSKEEEHRPPSSSSHIPPLVHTLGSNAEYDVFGQDLLELSALDDDTVSRDPFPAYSDGGARPLPHHHHATSTGHSHASFSQSGHSLSHSGHSSVGSGSQHGSSRRSAHEEDGQSQYSHRSRQEEDGQSQYSRRSRHEDDGQSQYSRRSRHEDDQYSQYSRGSSHHSHHTQATHRSGRSTYSHQSKRSTGSNKSTSAAALERAQWNLLYGDLQDVGKRDWERSLRR